MRAGVSSAIADDKCSGRCSGASWACFFEGEGGWGGVRRGEETGESCESVKRRDCGAFGISRSCETFSASFFTSCNKSLHPALPSFILSSLQKFSWWLSSYRVMHSMDERRMRVLNALNSAQNPNSDCRRLGSVKVFDCTDGSGVPVCKWSADWCRNSRGCFGY